MNYGKVILMAKIAVEDKRNLSRSRKVIGIGLLEYLFINCFFSFLAFTLAFFIGGAAYVVARFDFIMESFMKISLKNIGWTVFGTYLMTLFIYMLIVIIYYYRKYYRHRRFIYMNNRRIRALKRKYYE
ncbi:MAG: hypothetical protein Q4P30_00035 [Eubacteriales bacterium]|nr:hypothetical protein [Eubacteriales bacterium]